MLTFRSDVVAFGRTGPLRNIADRLDEIPDSAFAVGPGTNIASGLVSAADAIERAGGRGAVVLVSDGNETDGDGLAAAAQLAARGIAIHVLPIAAGAPALGILSANLPAYVDAGSETYVRGVLGNAAGVKQAATLALSAHAVSNGRPNGDALETRRAIEVAGRQWAQFRTPVVFAQPGLQFVDVAVDGQAACSGAGSSRTSSAAARAGDRRRSVDRRVPGRRDPGGAEGTFGARTVRVDRGLRRRRDRRGTGRRVRAGRARADRGRRVLAQDRALSRQRPSRGIPAFGDDPDVDDDTPLEPCCRSSARRAHGREARRRATS